jgi:hypothetical protein
MEGLPPKVSVRSDIGMIIAPQREGQRAPNLLPKH